MKKKKDTSIIQSLDKGLYLLEVIEQTKSPITLKGLWLKLRWDKATIYRLLVTLERRGYIYRDPTSKAYSLGIKIYGLYDSLTRHFDIQQVIRPYLNKILEKTGETSHLAVTLDKSIVFIDRVAGSEILSVNTQIGGREPLHCTALGKAYLAFVNEDEFSNLLEKPLPKYTPKTIATINDLKAELEKIRQKGYAVDNEEYIEGMRCIGAPILNQYKSPVAAIGISGPKHRISIKKCADYGNIIKKFSIEISKRFGYNPG